MAKHAEDLQQKLSSLQSMHDVVTKENVDMKTCLQNQEKVIKAFKEIQNAYLETSDEAKRYEDLYHSKKLAAASCVEELMMAVNTIEEQKGHASAGDNAGVLREETQRMKGHYDVRRLN